MVDHGIENRLATLEALSLERDRRYTERFTAQEGANKLALEAAEKAVLKAENASEKRFEAVNEFRATLSDQARTLATRTETTARFEALIERLDRLEKHDAAVASKGLGMSQLWGFIVGGLGLAGLIYTVIHG